MVVDQTMVTLTEMLKKVYVVSPEDPVRKRYYNHRNRFSHEIYRRRTSLSNYLWEIKKNLGTDPTLKWELEKKIRKYKKWNKYWRRNLP